MKAKNVNNSKLFKKTLQVGITVLNNKTFNSEKCSGL